MARPIRVEFTDAVYHVTARGNDRKAIYRDDQDRQRFLETVAEAHDRFGVVIDAYCLMSNHYHLLIETPRANLSAAVGWLQTTYCVRFNRRHRMFCQVVTSPWNELRRGRVRAGRSAVVGEDA